MKPDRVVLGGEDAGSLETPSGVFTSPSCAGKPRQSTRDSRSAEMSKYAANAILATKISFINETARLCEKEGDGRRAGPAHHGARPPHRPHFIYPGIGFGGSCLPKDIRAMIAMGWGRVGDAVAPGRGSGQRNPEGPVAGESRAAFRQRVGGAHAGALGPFVQGPPPTTCGSLRRSGSSTACCRPGRGYGRSIPRPGKRRGSAMETGSNTGDNNYEVAAGGRRVADPDGMERVPQSGFRAPSKSCCISRWYSTAATSMNRR